MDFLSQFIDANKLGGWVRAGVASGLAVLIGKFPGLSSYLDPGTQAAIGVAVAGIVVGAWSQLTKTDKAKVQMAADTVDPNTGQKTVVITSPAISESTPDQPNIVAHSDLTQATQASIKKAVTQ